MTQKLLKIGSSAGVTIPKESLHDLGLRVGDRLTVEIDTKGKKVTIRPAKTGAHAVDQDLLAWTDRFIERYRPALEALAKK